MDPFSGTASAIAILQLSGTIIASCYNYFSRVKSAAKDAKQIINELNSLRTVIESLLDILDEEDVAGTSKSILEKLAQENGSLNRCQTDLEELSRKLEPQQGWRQVKAVAMWPLKESDTKKVLSNIQDTKSTIQLALALDHRYKRLLAKSKSSASSDFSQERSIKLIEQCSVSTANYSLG
jgi:conjugal transfer/entry exclusion protein